MSHQKSSANIGLETGKTDLGAYCDDKWLKKGQLCSLFDEATGKPENL